MPRGCKYPDPDPLDKEMSRCGEEIEFFSNDIKVTCGGCGFVIYNDILSCVQWCKYAKECVGEETSQKFTAKPWESHRD